MNEMTFISVPQNRQSKRSINYHLGSLADVLKTAGFRTAAFVSSVVLSAQSGLDRGFDLYSDEFEEDGDDARFLNTIQKRGDITTDEAIAWLESNHGKDRLFAWIHLYDPHHPYEPPEPYASDYAERLYDGEVAWSDELVGRLDTAIDKLGLRDDTLLVLTSDHGEAPGRRLSGTLSGRCWGCGKSSLKPKKPFVKPGLETNPMHNTATTSAWHFSAKDAPRKPVVCSKRPSN